MANKSPPKKRIPLQKRSPTEATFVMTDRDVEILNAVNKYRYLSTDQIHRLLFSDNKTLQSARRRLKYLYHHKYLGRVIPYVQQGQTAGTMAYFLDKTGADYLKELGHTIKLWTKAKKIKHRNLLHALALSDFCIHLDQAINKNDSMAIETLIPDFEMRGVTDKAFGKKRYKLFTEVIHRSSRKSYTVYPDALIILTIELEDKIHKRLVFLEIDRGTMGMERIRDKLIGYNLYLEQKLHRKYLESEDFRLLFQTTSPKRAENIKNTLADMKGADLVWVTDVSKVNENSLLNEHIWTDTQGNLRNFTQPGNIILATKKDTH